MNRTPLEISGYWYWGLPFVVYLIPYVVNGLGLDNNILRGEQGAIELLTVLFLIVALLYWFPVFAGLYRMTTGMSFGEPITQAKSYYLVHNHVTGDRLFRR